MKEKYYVSKSLLTKEAKRIKKNSSHLVPSLNLTCVMSILVEGLGFEDYQDYTDIMYRESKEDVKLTFNIESTSIYTIVKIKERTLNELNKYNHDELEIYYLDNIIKRFINEFTENSDQVMLSTYLRLYPIIFNLDRTIIEYNFEYKTSDIRFFLKHLQDRYTLLEDKEKFLEIKKTVRNTAFINSGFNFIVDILMNKENKTDDELIDLIIERIHLEKQYIASFFYKGYTDVNKKSLSTLETHFHVPIYYLKKKNKNVSNDFLNLINQDKNHVLLGMLHSFFMIKKIKSKVGRNNFFISGNSGVGTKNKVISLVSHYIMNKAGCFYFINKFDNNLIFNMIYIASLKNREHDITVLKYKDYLRLDSNVIKSYLINRRIVLVMVDGLSEKVTEKEYKDIMTHYMDSIKLLRKTPMGYPSALVLEGKHYRSNIENMTDLVKLANKTNVNVIVNNESYPLDHSYILDQFNHIITYHRDPCVEDELDYNFPLPKPGYHHLARNGEIINEVLDYYVDGKLDSIYVNLPEGYK